MCLEKMSDYVLDTAQTVVINGESYYLRLRSENIENPVVLFLHGGCGCADRPFIMHYQSPLAAVCTVASWDQRGAGMAYNRKTAKKEKLTKELYINDTYNVVSYLRERFNKDKIIIVGHSFGSQLGVWFAQRYPECVQALVGIGQVVDFVKNEELSYDYALTYAKTHGDKKTVRALERIGRPVNGFYKDENNTQILKQRKYLNKCGGIYYGKFGCTKREWLAMVFDIMRKEYSVKTLLNYNRAKHYCLNSPLGKERVNFLEQARELSVPVYVFTGVGDYNCSFALAQEWFGQLKAPYKKWVWFEKSGHEPQNEQAELFNKTLAAEVLGVQL